MDLRERIAGWVEWRIYGPAAGSVATHVFLLAALGSMMAASGGERMPPPKPPAPPSLEVTLVAEAPPPQGVRPTPPDPRRAPPKPPPDKAPPLPEAPPVAERERNQQRQRQVAAPAMTGGAKSDDEGGVYLGESGLARSGVPLGLRGLLEADPCNPKYGPKRGDCVTRWDKKIGMNPELLSPSDEELKRMYPGLIPPCRYRVGCEGGEWISSIGTRSVFSPTGGPMMGGAGGQGGIGSVTGRLPLNPDHVDPAFGD